MPKPTLEDIIDNIKDESLEELLWEKGQRSENI